MDYYDRVRPHQAVGNVPQGKGEVAVPAGRFANHDVACEERLGGLLRHYLRAA